MPTWDGAKCQTILAKHGVDFADIEQFQWDSAITELDDRYDYGEAREIGLGLIGDRVYYLAYTRRGEAIRIISLRKANGREVRKWISRNG